MGAQCGGGANLWPQVALHPIHYKVLPGKIPPQQWTTHGAQNEHNLIKILEVLIIIGEMASQRPQRHKPRKGMHF